MGVLKSDYIGFSYNGVHSSELGIMRVSDGSRYNEGLLPTSKDITVQVPGGDGTYYFGSYYTQKNIIVSYAFDELTENQLQYLKELFGDRQIHPLIFDELPYKIYYAKVTGTTQIKYIPFDQNSQRIYKGEGTIQFVCHQPYAVCKKKFLNEYSDSNKEEWKMASNLLENNNGIDTLYDETVKVYNPGVKPADWRMTFGLNGEVFSPLEFSIGNIGALKFEGCSPKNKNGNIDSRLVFDSKTKMVEGFYEKDGQYYKSGNLYNEYISAGEFFDIPITILKSINEVQKRTLDFKIIGAQQSNFKSIEYNYYYY